MLGGLVIGFVVGVLVGILLTLAAVRRRAPMAEPAPPPSGVTAEPALAETLPGPDDEVQRALDATAGLLDDLETRYRNRKAPPEENETTRPRRRPRKS